jgi:hypothetical protein
MTSWTVEWILNEPRLTYNGTWQQERITAAVVYKFHTKHMGSKLRIQDTLRFFIPIIINKGNMEIWESNVIISFSLLASDGFYNECDLRLHTAVPSEHCHKLYFSGQTKNHWPGRCNYINRTTLLPSRGHFIK